MPSSDRKRHIDENSLIAQANFVRQHTLLDGGIVWGRGKALLQVPEALERLLSVDSKDDDVPEIVELAVCSLKASLSLFGVSVSCSDTLLMQTPV